MTMASMVTNYHDKNCNGIPLKGVTLPKFAVPAGKSSKVNAIA